MDPGVTMYRSYPGGREDRTIPVLPDFNRTADPRRRHSHKTQNAHVRPPRRHRRHTIAPRSFRGPARPHPVTPLQLGARGGGPRLQVQVAQRCQATPPFFGVHVLMSLISRTHYNTFSSHASYTQWGGHCGAPSTRTLAAHSMGGALPSPGRARPASTPFPPRHRRRRRPWL